MSMSARTFADQLKEVKAGVAAGHGDDEIASRLERVGRAFKSTCSPERFKEMLAKDEPVDSVLEEEMTTLWMLWTRRRGAGE